MAAKGDESANRWRRTVQRSGGPAIDKSKVLVSRSREKDFESGKLPWFPVVTSAAGSKRSTGLEVRVHSIGRDVGGFRAGRGAAGQGGGGEGRGRQAPRAVRKE